MLLDVGFLRWLGGDVQEGIGAGERSLFIDVLESDSREKTGDLKLSHAFDECKKSIS